jgi:hypothetical protein
MQADFAVFDNGAAASATGDWGKRSAKAACLAGGGGT